MRSGRKAELKRHSSVSKSQMQELRSELRTEKLAREASQREIAHLRNEMADLREELRRERAARNTMEEFWQKEVRRLKKEVADRDEKLEQASKQLVWFQKNFFGKTSEKAKSRPPTDEGPDVEPSNGRKNRGQQPGSKGHGRSDRAQLDTYIKFLEIPGCACGTCGTPFLLLPTTEESPLTEFEISIVRTIFQRCMYVSQCSCEGNRIVVAPPPPKLYPRTEIGNSLWVRLVVQKFLHGMPLNRTLKELSLLGLSLAAGTVIGGFKIIDNLLQPLFEQLVNHCRGADFWNADETTWRVFGMDKQLWWFWLIASDDAVVYLLDPSRSKKVPSEFFAGSVGILMTDRLASYKTLQESIRNAWCWIHQRRDIFNILLSIPALKHWAQSWLEDIARLFVLNHSRFKLWEADKDSGPLWEKSIAALNEHVRKLQRRWEKELRQPGLHKEQRKVLNSLKRHWQGLTLFLEDPRIPLHNNRAERLLRNAVILRKNSYGSGAPWAGRLAAKLFSLFQTWLINGLDPQALLKDYFDECSKTPGRPPPDLSQFLPWKMSEERKLRYALPESYKRPR